MIMSRLLCQVSRPWSRSFKSLFYQRERSIPSASWYWTRSRKLNKRIVEASLSSRWAIVLLAVPPVSMYMWWSQKEPTPINTSTFTTWSLHSSEILSPNAAVLHLAYDQQATSLHAWTENYKHGIWAIQVKQPQLQIQREYTPLPAICDKNMQDSVAGDRIRLYIRRVKSGELSSYLLNLPTAKVSKVEIRGPTYSWEYPDSANIHSILFLAGGTGIVPALQVASRLLSREPQLKMNILWANREKEEKVPQDVAYWVDKFQSRLKVYRFYDSQNHFICHKDIVKSISELDFTSAKGGKRMILVSGPEGFITALAGEKVWNNGIETQGTVKGLLASVIQNMSISGENRCIEVLKL